MRAIEQRRTICFVPSLDKRTHEVFVGRSAENSLEPHREVQQEIVLAAPISSHQGINEGARRFATGSPYPRGRGPITSGSESENDSTQETEEVEVEYEDSVSQVHQSLPESLTEENLASIQPPFVERSSKNHVSNWLSHTITPPLEETRLYVEKTNTELDIWRDTSTDGPSDTAFNRAILSNALRNATKLRCPGYLKHNSFARSSKKASQHKSPADESDMNEISGLGLDNLETGSPFAPKASKAQPSFEQNNIQLDIKDGSGRVNQKGANSPSFEAPANQLKYPVHEQSRGGTSNFGYAPSLLTGHTLLKSTSVSRPESSTPLPLILSRESAVDKDIQTAQFELARMRLAGYVVTDSSPESGMP